MLPSILNNTVDIGINPAGIPSECYNKVLGAIEYNMECIVTHICPQLSHHFVFLGIIIIILVIVQSWLLYWLVEKGYKHFTYNPNKDIWKFIGNIYCYETRIYWYTWIRSKLILFMTGYIAVVVWFNIRH
jgi:hypothetical protein